MEDDGEVVERTFTETVELYRVDGRFLFFRPDIDQRNRRRETGKTCTPDILNIRFIIVSIQSSAL